MNVLDLFSGIGGFALGFEQAGFEHAGFCEIDDKAAAVLAKHWTSVPNIKDVQDVTRETVEPLGHIDVITGGFPCQDVSVAGRRAGLDGERSGLWFEFIRVIDELKPQWVVIENVPGLLSSNKGADFGTILQGLVECGYGVCWRVLDAQYFGVAQQRRRVFIVGSLGDGRAAQVLFERESLPGNPPTRKQKGQESDRLYAGGADVTGTVSSKWAKGTGGPAGDELYNLVIETAWIECPDCDDYWCNIHGKHAFECDCSDIDTWGEYELWPYAPSALRRLTPTECERLQGFSGRWTAEGIDGPQSDSARYRQLGNAVAVPVARWIAERIAAVSA